MEEGGDAIREDGLSVVPFWFGREKGGGKRKEEGREKHKMVIKVMRKVMGC